MEKLPLVFAESETGLTMNARGFINYKLECDLSNLYIPFEGDIKGLFDERDDAIDNEYMEEVNNVQIGDVLVDRLGFKVAESALVTSKQCLEQRHIDVTPLI